MAETIKGIHVKIGAETTGLQAALKDVNQNARDIASELRQVERLLKFNPHDTELLAQKQQLLAQQVENTREKLDRLRTVQEQVNEQFKQGEISEGQYRAFQRELIKTESQLKNYEKQLKSTTAATNEFVQKTKEAGDKLQNIGKKMTDVGKNLSMKLTAPIVGLGTLATKAAVDFETAFAGVRKTVDATEAEFEVLKKGIREMAKEIPATAVEIAGVAEAAGQLGIANEHILSFTRTMIDLGEATNMSAETAATSLARLANITQMPQNQFDRLGSTIVALGNSLATTESEIVEMGLRLAGAGKQIGMTEAEILSLAGALSSVGIAAEAGGSALSKVMINMQLAVETGGEALDNFASVAGMSADQFASAFRENAAQALVAFIEGLQRAEAQGSSAIKVLDDIGITEVRMRDALLRAAGAGELFAESLKIGTQAWEENVALTNEATERYKTTESQLKILRNTLQDAAISFGEVLLPAINKVANAVKNFAEWLANLNPVAKTVIVVIAGLVAAIGPLLVVLGTVISSVGKIATALSTLAPFLTGTLIPAISSIALPLTTVGAAIWGAILVWRMFGDTITEFLKGAWEGLVNAISKFVNWLPMQLERIRFFFTDTFNKIKEFLQKFNLFEIGKNIIQSLINGIRSLIMKPVEIVRNLANSIKDTFKNILGISSPSKVFAGLGEDIVAGLQLGIERTQKKLQAQVEVMVKGMIPQPAVAGAGAGVATRNDITIIQNITDRATADYATNELVRKLQSRGVGGAYR